ncbi:hypothetical protein BKA62DRAFT_681390 [Auriculariales sp. MPI-PUGE-AT-0066]|nr:hypothetical protein BKA62DRAFT_681390 [Auriculariales sp. MPI-PUGE-AT-0066]
MKSPIDVLSDVVLDEILWNVFETVPQLRLKFLAGMGLRMSQSAMRVLFTELVIEDDMRAFTTWSSDPPALGPLAAVLQHPARYGSLVQRLVVRSPTRFVDFEPATAQLLQFDDLEDEGDSIHGVIRPLHEECIRGLLRCCPDLQQLLWVSATPPPDSLCETLSIFNVKLGRFSFVPEPSLIPQSPQTPVHARHVPPRWDASSLPQLAELPIHTLQLSRLSQTGARALGQLCAALGDRSNLEDVSLDFLWLDDTLCEKLVLASRRLRRLQLSSNGTKLTDRGVHAILEGVDSLEDFRLIEVEGRLSKTVWGKVQLPTALASFAVRIAEPGPHHSWIADHLGSLKSLSLQYLTTINICRIIHPFDNSLDDVVTLLPIPQDLVVGLQAARALRTLECDWWSWRAEHLKPVLEACQELRTLRIAFDGPFAKLLCLTSIFAPAPHLRHLLVYISRSIVPVLSPSWPWQGFPLTPGASPVASSTATLPSSVPTQTVSDSPSPNADDQGADQHIPPLREVKKFVRRCQTLTLLDWYGWNGRGSWTITRPPGVTKSTLNVTVEHNTPAPPSSDLYARQALEEDAARGGWFPGATEREGQAWTGAVAEMYAAQRQAEEIATPAKSTKTRKMSTASSIRDTSGDSVVQTVSASPPTSLVISSLPTSPAPLPPLKFGQDAATPTEPVSPTSPKRRTRIRRGTEASDVGELSNHGGRSIHSNHRSHTSHNDGGSAGRGARGGKATGGMNPHSRGANERPPKARGRGAKTVSG